MSARGMIVTVLASGLAAAVLEDEKPEAGGFDLSAGMFGPAVSAWIREVAASLHGEDQIGDAQRRALIAYGDARESKNPSAIASTFVDALHTLPESHTKLGQPQGGLVPQEWTNLLAYVLQDDMNNRLTPRVVDIAYTAFILAKQPNTEDGGASDWFNDTKPKVVELIAKLRRDLINEVPGQLTCDPRTFTAMRSVLEELAKALPAERSTTKTCYAINDIHRDSIHNVLSSISPVKIVNSQKKCSVCSEPQFDTPSGVSCINGHGGAPSMDDMS